MFSSRIPPETSISGIPPEEIDSGAATAVPPPFAALFAVAGRGPSSFPAFPSALSRLTVIVTWLGVKLSRRIRSTPSVARISASSTVRAWATSGSPRGRAFAFSTARASPPAALAWFSLMSIPSKSPKRWFIAPPTAVACFSSIRKLGVVFRVSRIFTPVPSTARTYARVSVATPDSRWRKFSATRSALRIARARPRISAIRTPGLTSVPSGTAHWISASGSSSVNASAATAFPARMPFPRASMCARTRALGSTTTSVVASPPPMSSVSAIRTSGAAIVSRRIRALLSGFQPEFVEAVPQRRGRLEFFASRRGEHLSLEQLDQGFTIQAQGVAGQEILRRHRQRGVGHGRAPDHLVHRLHDGLRRDAVLLVVLELCLAAAGHLVHRARHGCGHLVGVEDHLAVDVARGPPGGLDERGLRAEEPFLVRVQDRDQRDFREIQPFAEQVDPHQHIHFLVPQRAEDLHPLDRVDVRVDVADVHARLEEILRQVLRHALGQRGDQHALAHFHPALDLLQEVVDLALRGTDRDLGIDQPGGPDDLLHDDALGFLQLVLRRRGRDEEGLAGHPLELVEAERPVVQ